MAACSVYGPSAPPSAAARSSAARPRRISSRSQRARSWSSSRTGSPVGAVRARGARRLELHQRDEAVHLRLVGHQPGEDPSQPQRLLAQLRAHPVVAARGRVALVEDEVDDLEDRRRAARAARRRRGTSKRTRGLGERALGAHDALGDGGLGRRGRRARSPPVVSPPSSRSVSATRASVGSTGWQAMKTRPSRSSPIVVVERGRRGPGPAARRARASRRAACVLARRASARRRSWSIARCLAVVMSHAPGLSGTPVAGQRSSAATSASCARSSARPTSRTIRATPRDQPGGLDAPDGVDGRVRVGGQARAQRGRACVWSRGVSDSRPASRTSGGSSSISRRRRTSIMSPSHAGQRTAHSTASARERTSMIQ